MSLHVLVTECSKTDCTLECAYVPQVVTLVALPVHGGSAHTLCSAPDHVMLAAQIASMKLISIKGIYVATLVYQLYRIQTAQTAPDLVVKQAGGQLQVRHPQHNNTWWKDAPAINGALLYAVLRPIYSKSRAMRNCQALCACRSREGSSCPF